MQSVVGGVFRKTQGAEEEMNPNVTYTLIVSKELSEGIGNRIAQIFVEKESFFVRSTQSEPYWKDARLNKCIWEFSPTSPKTQSEWIALFDQVVCHNAVSTDADSMEIAHYSAIGDNSDPFAVLYIPSEWVKEKNE